MSSHGSRKDPHGLLARQDATRAFRPTGQVGGGLLGLLADFAPVLGDIKALTLDAPRSFKEGNVGRGLLALASIIPGMPSPKIIKKLMKNRKLAERMGGPLGRGDHPLGILAPPGSDVVRANEGLLALLLKHRGLPPAT